MKINFRQGIIKRQNSLTGPDWLQKTSLAGNSIDLNAQTEPVSFTVAHYSANYLLEETKSVIAAWGGGPIGSNNGPLTPGQACWLYWDVDLGTGALTRGWTLVAPYISATEPANPIHDTHWFDLIQNRTRVFRKPGAAAGAWQDKVRLFAASYNLAGTIVPYPIGSQVGITNGNFTTGNLILGVNNKPLKQSDGTFATTESELIIQQTSGQNVKFDMALVYAQAEEEIPKFHLISFRPNKRMMLASSLNTTSFVSGAVVDDLNQEEIGQVISNGVIRNEQWNFTADQINKPIFCGVHGEIVLNPPTVGVLQQVGFIYEPDSIYLNLFPPVRLT